MPFGESKVTKSLLNQIFEGTVDQLKEEGALLLGGHTSEGLELSLGFTVNGMVDSNQAWSKHGGLPGDVLVLTKPLGTGTIFAADMRFLAKGEWVSEALMHMTKSNRDAVSFAKNFDVHACTDITGFGLAGHCFEMIKPGVGVELKLSMMPVMNGAKESLNSLGISSSLHDANKRSSRLFGLNQNAEILFDPQTSGGLLFCVSEKDASVFAPGLIEAGYANSSIVGRVTDSGGIQVIG